MKQFKKWETAFQEQCNSKAYPNCSDNGINFSVESNVENMDALPYALGNVVWVIMADNYYLNDYEESAIEYGVTSDGQWAAVSDGHCSCYGWEATESNITYYGNLKELIDCDKDAEIILKHKEILVQVYPFLKKHFKPFAK
jgi:hypothetical protein